MCTGNICRSPAVERLLAAGLGPDSGVRVESAGVGAVVGAPVAPLMATRLDAAGVVHDGFAARQVTEQMVRDADLVLPLTRRHRSALVELAPSAVRRTFTLRELARLATAVGPHALPPGSPTERLAALVPLAAAQRGLHRARPEDDDVVDPWGYDESAYARSFDQMAPAVEAIVAVVRG
ncbi:low molecular weight phosphatase family protein [Actinotalea sp. Marseille-Q4924]|uniref:arsenate reductase/protein-tyrosine-phosphatase family protein n=1 Tax=Actinotalea sp. Marseille-Q4924 TaxID=2866571 RepID=UPI00210531C7|nr:low molecular weight phosphatase family protein [Actinotalea sp. Marseille-Q4924]